MQNSVTVYENGTDTWELHSRGGTLSPISFFLIRDKKRYTPFHRELLGISVPISMIFRAVYGKVDMGDLIYTGSPFFEFIPTPENYKPVPLSFSVDEGKH